MLCLGRRAGEKILILVDGREIWLTITSCQQDRCRIGIEAPPDVVVWREELLEKMTSKLTGRTL